MNLNRYPQPPGNLVIHEMKPRHSAWFSVKIRPKLTEYIINVSAHTIVNRFFFSPREEYLMAATPLF
jgi:hypothetical protein